MSLRSLTAAIAAALMIVPAVALAQGNSTSAPGHNRTTTTQTTTTPSPQGKAYGVYCKSFSKKHVAGQQGTPFSQCVKAMNSVAKSPKTNPAKACKAFSKRKAAGQKKSPYAQCVSAAAKLRNDVS